ncbi:MAG: class I SAM-dependent methyltransferase [Chitinophagaceae bacterium]|jgi:ubiquinone/menaquinone biosynthesis C-methylase UbiE|nr:class I SAM-dependent methyltransferase [Chitinophagaceae bacterium]
MAIQKQVDKSHYGFDRYVHQNRWSSFYHQINEIIKTEPNSILEVGVGAGISKSILKDVLHFSYESIDIDEELHPDHVGSVLDMPFADKQFDTVGCFEVLEHLPFDSFEKALSELFRVANKAVIISLPDVCPVTRIHIPRLLEKKMILKSFMQKKQHVFDGEHYWEINKKGYELNKVIKKITETGSAYQFILEKEYRKFENPYHHFFVLKK